MLDTGRLTSITTRSGRVDLVGSSRIGDCYTWLSEFKPRKDKVPVRPLPLDTQLNRKLAWNAIARTFAQAPTR